MNRYQQGGNNGQGDVNSTVGPVRDCGGACELGYDTSKGYLDCGVSMDGSIQRSQTGCIDYSYANASACEIAGGVWRRRAHSAAECDAQSDDMCFQKRSWTYSHRNASDCTVCGGRMKDPFRWSPGHWTTGQMRSLTWLTKSFAPVNAWRETIDWMRLQALFDSIAARSFALQAANEWLCSTRPLYAALKRVACDCGDVAPEDGTDCYPANAGRLQIGSSQFFPGVDKDENVGTQFIITSDGAAGTRVDVDAYTRDDMHLVLANLTLALQQQQQKRALGAALDLPNELSVVTNEAGAVVGQLASLVPIDVTFDEGDDASIQVCLLRDLDLPWQNDTYVITAWALFDEDAGTIRPTTDYAVLTSGEDYAQWCVNLTASATLYPVFLVCDWEDVMPTVPGPEPVEAAACPESCSSPDDCSEDAGCDVGTSCYSSACCVPQAFCPNLQSTFQECIPSALIDVCTGDLIPQDACGYVTCDVTCAGRFQVPIDATACDEEPGLCICITDCGTCATSGDCLACGSGDYVCGVDGGAFVGQCCQPTSCDTLHADFGACLPANLTDPCTGAPIPEDACDFVPCATFCAETYPERTVESGVCVPPDESDAPQCLCTLAPVPPPPGTGAVPEASGPPLSTGAVIGLVVGLVLAMGLCLALATWLVRRRRGRWHEAALPGRSRARRSGRV